MDIILKQETINLADEVHQAAKDCKDVEFRCRGGQVASTNVLLATMWSSVIRKHVISQQRDRSAHCQDCQDKLVVLMPDFDVSSAWHILELSATGESRGRGHCKEVSEAIRALGVDGEITMEVQKENLEEQELSAAAIGRGASQEDAAKPGTGDEITMEEFTIPTLSVASTISCLGEEEDDPLETSELEAEQQSNAVAAVLTDSDSSLRCPLCDHTTVCEEVLIVHLTRGHFASNLRVFLCKPKSFVNQVCCLLCRGTFSEESGLPHVALTHLARPAFLAGKLNVQIPKQVAPAKLGHLWCPMCEVEGEPVAVAAHFVEKHCAGNIIVSCNRTIKETLALRSCTLCSHKCTDKTMTVVHLGLCHRKMIPYLPAWDRALKQAMVTQHFLPEYNPRMCPECKLVCYGARSLSVHVSTFHSQRETMLGCKQCQMEFCTYTALERHVEDFHREAAFGSSPGPGRASVGNAELPTASEITPPSEKRMSQTTNTASEPCVLAEGLSASGPRMTMLVCEQCKMSFCTLNGLETHIKDRHGEATIGHAPAGASPVSSDELPRAHETAPASEQGTALTRSKPTKPCVSAEVPSVANGSGDVRIRCPLCSAAFSSLGSLGPHLRNNHDAGKLADRACVDVSKSAADIRSFLLAAHMAKEKKQKVKKGGTGTKVLSKIRKKKTVVPKAKREETRAAAQISASAGGVVAYPCLFCGKVIPEKGLLNHQAQVHFREELEAECEELVRESVVRGVGESYSCSLCREVFFDRAVFVARHLGVAHGKVLKYIKDRTGREDHNDTETRAQQSSQ